MEGLYTIEDAIVVEEKSVKVIKPEEVPVEETVQMLCVNSQDYDSQSRKS